MDVAGTSDAMDVKPPSACARAIRFENNVFRLVSLTCRGDKRFLKHTSINGRWNWQSEKCENRWREIRCACRKL